MRVRRKLTGLLDYSLLGYTLAAQGRDGTEGERLILQHQPDAMITDAVMPGKTGLQMIAALQDRTQAKFVILSGYQDFGYAREALRLGAADYVLKPVQAPEPSRKGLCANTLFMNETYVSRLLQKRTGQKFSSYVTACRLKAAQALTTSQPDLPAGEAARQVGFGGDAKCFI